VANELSRTNAVKKKLETLCKELQKQNKTVLDQSKQVSAEEQEKRKELSDRFSETIKDVQDKIASHDEERQKQDQENTKLREQLQSFLNQYEVRDKHFEHQLHAKDLEVQLAEAKLKQSEELCNKAIERAELYRYRQSAPVARVTSVFVEQLHSRGSSLEDSRHAPPGGAAGSAGGAAGGRAAVTLAACFLEDSRQAPRRRRRAGTPAAVGLGRNNYTRRVTDNPHDVVFWRIRFNILEDSVWRVSLTVAMCVCRKQALEMAEREVVLKEQMNTYSEKFQELQETLTKSNEVFTSFKKDSEKMQKRIKASEKERLVAERLAQKNGKELADITEKHEALKKESANLKKQKERMEMLCRTLTQERADLKDKLRALGALPGPDLTPGLASSDEASAASEPAAAQEDGASQE